MRGRASPGLGQAPRAKEGSGGSGEIAVRRSWDPAQLGPQKPDFLDQASFCSSLAVVRSQALPSPPGFILFFSGVTGILVIPLPIDLIKCPILSAKDAHIWLEILRTDTRRWRSGSLPTVASFLWVGGITRERK